MTHNQFMIYTRTFWVKGRDSSEYLEHLVEYQKDLTLIINKFGRDYVHGLYTDTINKEVEALWLQRNSKLAKALK